MFSKEKGWKKENQLQITKGNQKQSLWKSVGQKQTMERMCISTICSTKDYKDCYSKSGLEVPNNTVATLKLPLSYLKTSKIRNSRQQ